MNQRGTYRSTPVMWVAYVEAAGAGAVVAGLQAAYQTVQAQGHTVDWQPVVAAFLVGAMGYLLAALRWLQTPVPVPPVETPAVIPPPTGTIKEAGGKQ